MESITVIGTAILFIWIIGLSYIVYSLSSRYSKLIRGNRGTNLTEIVNKSLESNEKLLTRLGDLETQVSGIQTVLPSHIQKVGVIRFNPFSDTGGDQSFVLALLDGTNTGIVLTSLHNRGVTRWYAKNVKQGKGEGYDLTAEEQKAIKHATH